MEKLIAILSPTERKSFVHYLRERNKRQDVRNLDLFRKLVDGNEAVLKKELGANTYYALYKRLKDNLLEFLGSTLFDQENYQERELIKLILVARKLLETGESQMAFRFLRKAETGAKELTDFLLLQQVYHVMIEYSHLDDAPEQAELIEKLEKNTSDLLQNERLNLVFAMIRKAFTEKEYHAVPIRMESLIQELLTRYEVNESQVFTFKSLYQLAEISDIYGASTKNYAAVDVFFAQHLEELAGGPSDNESNLLFHIDLAYILANIYFRKRQFGKSKEYLHYMFQQMQRSNGRFTEKRMLRHRTLLMLNQVLSGRLEDAYQLAQLPINVKTHPLDDLLKFELTRAMVFFYNQEMDQVRKLLATFSRTDAWYERNIGLEWVLNKTYMEILLYLDLEAYDFVEARLHNFTRKYKVLLHSEEHWQVNEFIRIIRYLCRNSDEIQSKAFERVVEEGITWKTAEQEDVFYMCYYGWLKAKMQGTPIYATTLQLLNEH